MTEENAVVVARRALHLVAEQLLAGPQYRTSGTIRLTVTREGFATVRAVSAGISGLEVRGGDLVREPDGRRVALAGSVRDVAGQLGLVPGPPIGVYPEITDHPRDGVLDLPEAGVDVVLQALISGDQALRSFAATVAAASASTAAGAAGRDPAEPVQAEVPVLWPEHFDLGLSSGEVNYGISPGDAGHPLPYAYVGPWTPRQGGFWNEPFGASRPLASLDGVEGIVEFLLAGRTRAELDPKAQ